MQEYNRIDMSEQVIIISMNELERELAKLEDLAPRPVDYSFALGYLVNSLPYDGIPNFRPALKQLLGYLDEALITSKNVLELLVILRVRTFKDNFKGFVAIIQNYGTELVCDNNYLFSRFFERKPVKEREKEGLGIECSICTVEIDTKSLCMLTCSHMYHRECFNEFSKEQIAKKSIPLRCPTEECRLQVSNEEIREFLSRELNEKYDDFMFQNYVDDHMEDTSWCPTPGCKAVFTFDEGLDNYKCPSCKKHYCLACKCEMHTGITCAEYQSMADLDEPDRKFMILVKGSKFKQCPNCKFWVEKNEGCDHMTCRCKYEFCYICGGKYGACACMGGARVPPPIPAILPVIPNLSSDEEEDYLNDLELVPGLAPILPRPIPQPLHRRPVMRAPPAEVRRLQEQQELQLLRDMIEKEKPPKDYFKQLKDEPIQIGISSNQQKKESQWAELMRNKEASLKREELMMENRMKQIQLEVKPRRRASPAKEEEASKIQERYSKKPYINRIAAKLPTFLRPHQKKQQK